MANPQRVLPALFILALGFAPSSVNAEDGSKIYLNGLKSTVLVGDIISGHGSGSVVNVRDGYIITNWHVVYDEAFEATKERAKKNKQPAPQQHAVVFFPKWDNGRPIVEFEKYKAQGRKIAVPATVIASDPKIDLAVIKIDDLQRIPQGTAAVKFADDSPLPGTKLVSIGNPTGSTAASDALWIYTPGEVRTVYQKQWKDGDKGGKFIISHDCRVIEATSPVNPGDSGGPCFNDKGEQVGVAQSFVDVRAANSFSLFVDASEVKTFLKKNKVEFNLTNDGPNPEIAKKDAPPMVVEPKKDAQPVKKEAEPVKKEAEPVKKDPEPKDPAAEAAAKQEKEALNQLNLIRKLVDDPSRKSFVIPQLEQIIKLYPKTQAAKEAQELLKKLK